MSDRRNKDRICGRKDKMENIYKNASKHKKKKKINVINT
jgi:hypothetical protein